MPRSLARYREMRDFGATPEPTGRSVRGGGPAANDASPVFVVQKHAATRLHYDFRLEFDGVLLSWAVPREPSMSVGVRRLAVRTEDHPVEYASFHGDIPQGHYGAGHVELWDRGSWRAIGDPAEGLRSGRLEFELSGRRLSGRFLLVRMHAAHDERREHWLLIRARDTRPDEADAAKPARSSRKAKKAAARSAASAAAGTGASMRAAKSAKASVARGARRPQGDRHEPGN